MPEIIAQRGVFCMVPGWSGSYPSGRGGLVSMSQRLIEHAREVGRFAPVRPAVKAGIRAAIAIFVPVLLASAFQLSAVSGSASRPTCSKRWSGAAS